MPLLRVPAALAVVLSLALIPAAARADGDPIMPLADVAPGMQCTGYSVIRGTAISSFSVSVIDVIAGKPPQILVSVSGPAVDDTGIAEGFSGSPVKCPDAAGVARTIGAIAQGTGDYGNKLVLVTPIEDMLGEPVDVPRSATPAATSAALRHARPLATPITFGGVTGPVAAALRQASAKVGRQLYAAPAAPRAAFDLQPLVPGASVAVGLASGDISAGAVGTVTYTDGDAVWAFGHPLDGAGRRSLLLQDAYVYTVVGNPLDTEESTSYKLAAAGHDVGTLTNDAPEGVVGRVGALPDTFPLIVSATDLDSGRAVHYTSQIADETAVGQPTGVSSLTQVAPVAVAQAAYDALRGSPARQSGQMCLRITLKERPKPLRFCNTYVGGSPSAVGAPMAADVATATALVDAYNFGVLHVTGVQVDLKLRRSLRQAFLLHATARHVVRRGSDLQVRVVAQHVRGPKLVRHVAVHVPRNLSAGEHVLVLRGTSADGGGNGGGDAQDLTSTFTLTLGDSTADDEKGPTTVAALAGEIADVHRDNGVTASFRDPGDTSDDTATHRVEVLDDPDVRISGSTTLTVTVRPQRKP